MGEVQTVPPAAPETVRDLTFYEVSGRRYPLNEHGVPVIVGDEEETETGTETDKTAPFKPLLRTNERARFTVMTGESAGRVIPVEREEIVIGRGRDAHVALTDPGVSRRHARVSLRSGRHLLEDLNSTNGTLCNGRPIRMQLLNIGDRIQIGPNVVLQFALFDDTEEALARRLYEASTRDPLTNVYNRRFFLERLDAEVAYAARHKTDAAVLVFDIDHFKRVNDTYGHGGGDAVLADIARCVGTMIRTEDVFARWGGEEFVLLVRGITPRDVFKFAQRVREGVSKLRIEFEAHTLSITISVGLANLREEGLDTQPEELVKVADTRLYQAKAAGRNRVCAK